MIVVRNTFTCKPGCASKLAAQMKDAMGSRPGMKARILTDMTGEFNRVVMEFDVANLGELESRMKEYETDANFREKMKGYTDLYVTGTRELFKMN